MSRTYHHTTPAFPRSLRGPRGAQIVAPTPCAECVAFQTCRPGACSAPFGCDSWVDYDGRRVDVEADQARFLAEAGARPAMTEADLGAVLGTLEDGPAVELTPEEAADLMPTPCEECGGLPSECRPCGCPHVEPDPGPLFQR